MGESRERIGLWRLAGVFLRLGAVSYGGPAIVAQIRREVVTRRNWIDDDRFADSLAFVQMIPGPIAVNTVAHVAWRLHGTRGALLAAGCYFAPASVLMLALSSLYVRHGDLPAAHTAFAALGAVVVALVADAIIGLARPAVKDLAGLALAAAAATAFWAHLNPVVVLAAAALAATVMRLKADVPAAGPSRASPFARRSQGRRAARAAAVAAAGALLCAAGVVALRPVRPQLAALATTMARIDLLAFGGGYTAAALMYDATAGPHGHRWLHPREFIDGLALGQATPGPVMITATFVGVKVAGLAGGLVATVAVFLPSTLLLVLLAPYQDPLRRVAWVQRAMRGLLAGFVGMMLYVLAEVAREAIFDWSSLALTAAAFVAVRLGAPAVAVIAGALSLALLAA